MHEEIPKGNLLCLPKKFIGIQLLNFPSISQERNSLALIQSLQK